LALAVCACLTQACAPENANPTKAVAEGGDNDERASGFPENANSIEDIAEAKQVPSASGLPFRSFPAHEWTGKKLILWDGYRALSFDPNKNSWRPLATNPHVTKNCRSFEMSYLADNQLVVGYVKGARDVHLDRYAIDEDVWAEIGVVDEELLGGSARYPEEKFYVDGSTRVGDCVLFFISCNYDDTRVKGIRVDARGKMTAINEENAPYDCYSDPVVYSDGQKVLYWGYWRVGAGNAGGIWDGKTDRWQPIPPAFGDRYSSGHCCTGEEVVIFGGAYSSAFGWIRPDGLIYSFKTDKWRKLPLEGSHAPKGRRDFYMCWTGEEVFVWGGWVTERFTLTIQDIEEGTGGYTDLGNGALLNPKTGIWRPVSSQDAPTPRAHGICAWTGREVLVLGGLRRRKYTYDGYAYDPRKNQWRKLPDVPSVD